MAKKLTVALLLLTLILTCGCTKNNDYNVAQVTDAPTSVKDDEGQAVILDGSGEKTEVQVGSDKPTEAANATGGNNAAPAKQPEKTNSTPDKTVTADTAAKPAAPTKKDSGSVSLNGKGVKIGMKVTDSLIDSIGKPNDIQNAPSCHYDGNDTIYCYGGYTLYTYANGSDNILYLVQIDSSNVSTELGIKVGSSIDDVKAKYGEPDSETGTSLVYDLGSSVIRFDKSGNSVTGIDYEEK